MMRERLRASITSMACHVKENGYHAIVVSGGSGKVSKALLTIGWQLEYGEKPSIPLFDLGKKGNNTLYRYYVDSEKYRFIDFCSETHVKTTREYLARHHAELVRFQDSPVIHIDDYADSGMKLDCLVGIWPAAGFGQMGYGVFGSRRKAQKFPPNLFISSENYQFFRFLKRLAAQYSSDAITRGSPTEQSRRVQIVRTSLGA